jgi:hypothetical protein
MKLNKLIEIIKMIVNMITKMNMVILEVNQEEVNKEILVRC